MDNEGLLAVMTSGRRIFLTKSDLMAFMRCPFELWLKRVRPDLMDPIDEATQRLFAEGNRVDDLARLLHPGGFEVQGYNAKGFAITKKAIGWGRRVLYQPTAVADDIAARADILVKDGERGWRILEVKMTTKVKNEHYYDLAFQRLCFESAGIPITGTSLVHIDSSYVRSGEIRPELLFAEEDITQDVLDRMIEVEEIIPQALSVYEWSREPAELELAQCPEHARCGALSPIVAALGNEIEVFLGSGSRDAALHIMNVCEVDRSLLSQAFIDGLGEIPTPEERWPRRIDEDGISAELRKLQYPIHFLDYETYSSAIPPFDGYRPYQQIPFQFSVYVIEAPGDTPKTYDYLHGSFDDPAEELVDALRGAIGPEGSVVSWHAPFEKGRNDELAQHVPEHAEFLQGINERMYDLMLIFKGKRALYMLPEFGGSASLKNVMPVVVPDLSYEGLNIQEGGTASASWPILVAGALTKDEMKQLRKDMIDYCRLDVFGMVKIYEYLRALGKS